jgi:hypothetical protein
MERKTQNQDFEPLSLEGLRRQLSIDDDDLDRALIEQPDLYYHVAAQYVEAVAERDAAKLDLEQAQAELDGQFRRQAVEQEAKITDAAVQRKIVSTPRVQTLERDYLKCRGDADKWLALKEAFQQRSFMLRELVSIRIAHLGNLTIEKGVRGAQRDLAEAHREAAGRMRQERRTSRAVG